MKKITEKDIHKLVLEALEKASLEEVGFGWGSSVGPDTSRRVTGIPSARPVKSHKPNTVESEVEELKFLFNSIVPKKGLTGKVTYVLDSATYEQMKELLDQINVQDLVPTTKMDVSPTAKMAPEELPTPKLSSEELPTTKSAPGKSSAKPVPFRPLKKVAESKK